LGLPATQAIDAMSQALDAFEVEGIGHNLPFLSAVMEHPRFRPAP
jgi:propionyl-CoA carboxylase alpha chain